MKILYEIVAKIKKIVSNIKLVKLKSILKNSRNLFKKVLNNLRNTRNRYIDDSQTFQKLYSKEALSKIRLNIDTIVAGGSNKCIIVTSPRRLEGKTTFCIYIARYLAKMGKKVLLIDCNMRAPRIGEIFGINPNKLGLSDMLTSQHPWQEFVSSTNNQNLFVISAGSCVTDTVGLLSSITMGKMMSSVVEKYDYVLLDTPSILQVPDTVSIAKHDANTFLIVRHQFTRQKDISSALDALDLLDCKIRGIIYNDVPISKWEKKLNYHTSEK